MSNDAKSNILHNMYEARLYPDEYNSEFSETIKVEAEQDRTIPETPASISATEKIGKVTLEWNKPTTNQDGSPLNDLERYKVYKGTTASFATASASTQWADTTSFEDNNQNYGTTFAYRVSTVDYSENESPLTQEVMGGPQKAGTADNVGVRGEVYSPSSAPTQISDTDDSAVFDSNNRFRGSLIRYNGALDDTNSSDTVLISIGPTIPANKKWIIVVTLLENWSVSWTGSSNILSHSVSGYFEDSGGTLYRKLSSGSYSDYNVIIDHELKIESDGDVSSNNVRVLWRILEVVA